MLNEGDRLIKPAQIKAQVDWQGLQGVVVLGLSKKGEVNTLQMSSISVDELCLLSKQLDAHITCMLGAMKEI